MKYFMFVDIQKVNLDNLNIVKLNKIFPKINITIRGNEVTYKDKEKTLIEVYHEDLNKLKYSEIYFSSKEYDQEFIGYKFFSNDIVLILIKSSYNLFSDFSFYEMNEEIDYIEIVNNQIFNKIDLNKYNVSGYKFYIYFYINALIIKLKDKLRDDGIIIKIIDDKIDDFVDNYINQAKSIKNAEKFIFIYSLLFKEHSAVLVDITGVLYLFDPSHYFEGKKNIIFKNLKDRVITINIYKIQNLGVCSYYSIIFINIIIEYLIINRKELKIKDDRFLDYVNSDEFISILVNKLNEFFKNNEKLFLIKGKETNCNKEIDNKFIELSKNIFINQNIYKIIFIDLEGLFKYIKKDYDRNVFYLILKENKLYLKLLENKYLYEKLIDIITDKLYKNFEKFAKAASKKIFDYKIKKQFLDNNLIEVYFKKIFIKNEYFFIDEQKKNEIKRLLKEELVEELDYNSLNKLKKVIINNIALPNKKLFELIQNKIKEDIESKIIANIFIKEFDYYTEALEEISSKLDQFEEEQKKIIKFLEQINENNDFTYKTKKTDEIIKYIKKLDEDGENLKLKIEEFG